MKKELREKAIALRKKGKTFSEINNILGINIPQGTLSYWFKNIDLSDRQKERINKIVLRNIKKGQIAALKINKIRRQKYLDSVAKRVNHLGILICDKNIAKIALSMLYLGEGSKTKKGSLMFGNSDPEIITLFLSLLRYCYKIEESKFRCTVQLRADQNVKKLEKFWHTITKIPTKQFYKTRIDSRTIGKISKKPEYKGVCRIDYFSADIFNELKKIVESVYKNGPVA
ncbi:MAG: hypothetical protein AAB757_00065 [Patescibacteria group bacterium]